MFHGRGCPVCGGEGNDEMLKEQNYDLKKKIFDLQNQLGIIHDKTLLQEDVIKEQIKSIYDYVKSAKESSKGK